MSHIWPIFLLIAAALAGFAWSTAWSRRDTRVRHLAVAAFVTMLPLLAVAGTETLGWHKPLPLAWRIGGDAYVMASKLVRDEGIYLYLDVGGGEPRSVVLPWDAETAKQLQEAERRSRERGQNGAIMKYHFDPSLDPNPPEFHPLPQPRLPIPKGEPPEEPHRYERSA